MLSITILGCLQVGNRVRRFVELAPPLPLVGGSRGVLDGRAGRAAGSRPYDIEGIVRENRAASGRLYDVEGMVCGGGRFKTPPYILMCFGNTKTSNAVMGASEV